MGKGFSTLELSAVIICLSVATHGAASDRNISLHSAVSKVQYVGNTTASLINPLEHFKKLDLGLQQINGS